MESRYLEFLRRKLSPESLQRLIATENIKLLDFIGDAVELCEPENVLVLDDSEESVRITREKAIESGEETTLGLQGHTVHFDGPDDQGRDREVTRYLVPKGQTLSKALNQIDRDEGLSEIRTLLRGSMKNRTMIVRFLTLGPNNSIFSIPCVECTDSWYVSHSLNLLYRQGYEHLKSLGASGEFFAILHSSGKVNERMVSIESDKKRIYIDYVTDTVYSVNTQYAGNTVGLKKLALRLTIRKADREGWLAEHMFLMGVNGPDGRKTYFGGAFPSACGKTSTAMLPGEKILGDDIAYFRSLDGEFRAVNAESGIFGIIQSVNEKDDPAIWDVLTRKVEVIFSNVLVKDAKPYWLDMGISTPDDGIHFTGQWYKGKKDAGGNAIPLAHKNARYAVSLNALANCDSELENPDGIALGGIMYGGRDAKGYVPVQQSFDWNHGIIAYGASLETETTFAIIGKEGIPEINMMSIQDFVPIPLGKHIKNNLEFVKKIKNQPLIFGVNYFLRNAEGKFLNAVRDKHIWVKWMELRVHHDVGAVRTPTGWIPKYEDLVPLFQQVLKKNYAREDYITQFTTRVPENLSKIDRVVDFYKPEEMETPPELFEVLEAQRRRLLEAQKKFGDYVSPECFPAE
ncbi:MAG: phosphoenolpyruvate carboxykinase (GTP) [Deltaproteobacteria bacterium]|nr:phosphoenolpyruvate carboxykinase (GTP) [Deltaproteobacteria bacterium]